MAKILNYVEEIKEDLKHRKELEIKRLDMLKRMEKGAILFEKEKDEPTHSVNTTEQSKHLQDSARQFSEIVNILIGLENDIREIDNAIVMKFESLLSDFVLKFEIPHRIDLTGNVAPKEHAVLVPFRTKNPEYIEIRPEDLKFILFIKDHFNIRNFNSIELINKENYYNVNGGMK